MMDLASSSATRLDWSIKNTDDGVRLSRGPAKVTVTAAPSYGATFAQHVDSLRNPVLDAPGRTLLAEGTVNGMGMVTAQVRPARGKDGFRRVVMAALNGGFFIDGIGVIEDAYLAEYGDNVAAILESLTLFSPEADAAVTTDEQSRDRYMSVGVEFRPLVPDAEHRGPSGGGRILDIERFAFVGVEGATYRVTSDAEAVRTRLVVRIASPDGCTLVQGVDVDYTWRADQSGLYTLDVDSTASHRYVLTVTKDVSQPADDHGGSACNAVTLDPLVGGVVTGEITHPTEFDVFAFDALAGSQYLVELELGTLEEAGLVIQRRGAYLPEHRQRSGGSEEPIRVVVDAEEAETYGIEVRGSILPWKLGNDAKGTYTLSVTPMN